MGDNPGGTLFQDTAALWEATTGQAAETNLPHWAYPKSRPIRVFDRLTAEGTALPACGLHPPIKPGARRADLRPNRRSARLRSVLASRFASVDDPALSACGPFDPVSPAFQQAEGRRQPASLVPEPLLRETVQRPSVIRMGLMPRCRRGQGQRDRDRSGGVCHLSETRRQYTEQAVRLDAADS
jgi:hypothetical protein